MPLRGTLTNETGRPPSPESAIGTVIPVWLIYPRFHLLSGIWNLPHLESAIF
jgi:hypothetical protein